MTPRGGRLPVGTPVTLDSATVVHAGHYLLGGSPWRVARLAGAARVLVERARAVGDAGTVPDGDDERRAADLLVERGMAHPVPAAGTVTEVPGVTIVVPAFGRPDLLARCLDSVASGSPGVPVVVVDDASPDGRAVADVVPRRGASIVRHATNAGPGAARNTGLEQVTTDLVAFLDSDCEAPAGWLEALVPLFDDRRVGAVAPRVVPGGDGAGSTLGRFEAARSALDMGPHRRLVRPGARLGFLPSAALVVRRDALGERAFDAGMRVGEDVDLVWWLADRGWHVRYEPSVHVRHETRVSARAWIRRRYEYGTSAADLDRRHPGRLAPAMISGWSLAVLSLLVAGRPVTAGGVQAVATALLARRVAGPEDTAGTAAAGLAARVVAQGVVADAVSVGHALRREWWPAGWVALAVAARTPRRHRVTSTAAGAMALAMLGPIALEWWRTRPAVPLWTYTLLRLAEDAAYGSGVLVSAVRGRRPRALLPVIRLPDLGQSRARAAHRS